MNFGKKTTLKKRKLLNSRLFKLEKKLDILLFKLFLIGIVAVTLFCVFGVIGIVKGILHSAPDISAIDVSPSGYYSIVYDSSGNEITKLVSSGANREYVSIDNIPLHLQHAFIAIEDERFYEHNGIDLAGIIRAGFVGLKSGRLSEGASTITQQLLKNNVFTDWTQEDSLSERVERKIQEQYLALELEKTLSKDQILEDYLNSINLGQNSLGVQAASLRYFNKTVSELTISECAVIAAITQNPSKYNPITYPDNNNERRVKVLDNMLAQGYISETEYTQAVNDNVYERIQIANNETSQSSPYSYFVDELTEQIVDDLEEEKGYTQTQAYNALYSGGLRIFTTQDSSIQTICDEEFSDVSNYPAGTQVSLTYRLTIKTQDGEIKNYSEQSLKAYFQKNENPDYSLIYADEATAKAEVERYKAAILSPTDTITNNGETISLTPQPQASMVVMDQYTGEVKAIVGGRGEKNASLTLNRATNTTRQPGSTFKVLAAFAPAIDAGGKTLATVYDDAPYNYSNGRPVSNYYSGYNGLSTIREAITLSMNIIAVKTITDITPQVSFDYLQNFGFTTLVENRENADGSVSSDINQALALGGITDGITNLEITAAYASIANSGTYTEPIFYTKILDHEGNVIIDNTPNSKMVLKDSTSWLLTDAMKDVVKKGTATTVSLGDMPVAGKTGTTSLYNDVWFCGYTPYYTCSVWGGYDTNEQLPSGSRDYHKTIWKEVMSRIHENLEVKDFTMPADIEKAVICKKSGNLAVSGLCDKDTRGSQAVEEYFATGTVPKDICTTHVGVTLCNVSGLLINEFCPEANRVFKVFMVRPEGSTGETNDTPYTLPANLLNSFCNVHAAPVVVPVIPDDTKTDDSKSKDTKTDKDSTSTDSKTDTTTDDTEKNTDVNDILQ